MSPLTKMETEKAQADVAEVEEALRGSEERVKKLKAQVQTYKERYDELIAQVDETATFSRKPVCVYGSYITNRRLDSIILPTRRPSHLLNAPNPSPLTTMKKR